MIHEYSLTMQVHSLGAETGSSNKTYKRETLLLIRYSSDFDIQ